MHGYSMHDSVVEPVLEWAAQGKRAIFVHCGALSVGVRQKLGLPSPFDLRFSNPIDLHAVAARHPQVPFIVPHFGAGYLREALMLADLCPNVYLDTSSSNRWMRYQESHVDLRQVFRHALDVVGPKRLLFGSDSSYYPAGLASSDFRGTSKALVRTGRELGRRPRHLQRKSAENNGRLNRQFSCDWRIISKRTEGPVCVPRPSRAPHGDAGSLVSREAF